MGLHLCYELALPPDTPESDVAERVRRLYAEAVRIPFELVGPFVRTTAGESLGDEAEADDPLGHWFRLGAAIRLDDRDPVTGGRTELLPDAIGFAVHPGRGCEAATFGLARVPPEDDEGNPVHGLPLIWHWHSTCKTQYASVVSDEHLIHCHTSLVALLEAAERLGFQVIVRDETHYWETRDAARLVAEVHEMNRIVAHFAGALHDAIGDRARVDGAIFEHPDFEELETRAVTRDPPP